MRLKIIGTDLIEQYERDVTKLTQSMEELRQRVQMLEDLLKLTTHYPEYYETIFAHNSSWAYDQTKQKIFHTIDLGNGVIRKRRIVPATSQGIEITDAPKARREK